MRPDINACGSDQVYPETALVGIWPHMFPPQVQAGTERFFERRLQPL